MQSQIDINSVWAKTTDKIKHQIIHPTLWRTLEAGVPVLLDGKNFVVGFRNADYHLSGNLVTSEHKRAIEVAIAEFAGGGPYDLRTMEGTTLNDWEQVKAKEASMEVLREEARKRRDKESAQSKSWDTLLESIARTYANTPLRQLPQVRAKYVEEIVKQISDTMDVLIPAGSTDELAERSLARAIEKAATLVEIPGTAVALELARYRRSR
jgi:hypothetical protein